MALLHFLDRVAKIRHLLGSGRVAPIVEDLRNLRSDVVAALADERLSREEAAKVAVDALQLALDVALAKVAIGG